MSFRFFSGKDYFSALNLATNADEDQIKKSYHHFSRLYHPDRNKGLDNGSFIRINKAYETLGNEKLRQVCQIHLECKDLGGFLDNLANAHDSDNSVLEQTSVNELLRKFDEYRFFKKSGKPRVKLDKTIIHVDQSMIEQHFTYGKMINGSTQWQFCRLKGATFGYNDEVDYESKKIYYGFNVDHKGYKRKQEKKLTIFGNVYDYHLSMYKISAHVQHPLARIEPFFLFHDFFTQDQRSIMADDDDYDTFSRNMMISPGVKLRIHYNYVFKKDVTVGLGEITLAKTSESIKVKAPLKLTINKVSVSFCPFSKVMIIEYKSDSVGSFAGMSLQPLVRINIADWLEMAENPDLETIWNCISPVCSIKFVRHGAKTSLDEVTVTDIIDAITVKSPDIANAVKAEDENGNTVLLAENRLMLSLSYVLQSNQVILSTPISIPISYYSLTKSPEAALKKVILPFLFMVAIRNERVQEKAYETWSYLSSLWQRKTSRDPLQ